MPSHILGSVAQEAQLAGQHSDAPGRGEGLMERADRWSTFIFSNLIWMLLAVPVVTLPLAMVGMFNVMSKWVRGKQPEFFRDFLGGIREYWWKAMLIGLLDALVGGLVVFNMLVLSRMEFLDPLAIASRSVTLFIALLLVTTNLYIWSLLVVSELPLKQILMTSLKLVFAHPFRTIGTLIAGLLPAFVSIVFSIPALFWVLGLFSLSAMILNWGTWRVIRRYVSEGERSEYESRV